MADITKIQLKRNLGTTTTATNGAASQTIVFDRSDENIIIHVTNTDAANCLIRIQTNGYGGQAVANTDITVNASTEMAIGMLESMFYKDPTTQSVTIQVLATGGGAFGGTVTNVKFRVYALPKSLTN